MKASPLVPIFTRSTARLAASLLFIALACLAQACGKGDCPKPPEVVEEETLERVDDLLDDGDVTDDQRARAMTLAKGLMPSMHRQRAEQGELFKGIMEELMTGKADPAKVEADTQKVMDSMRGFGHELVDVMAKVNAMLEPEQRAELVERFEEPKEPFEPGFKMNAGLKLALMKFDATDAQETIVYAQRDKLVALARGVLDKHHDKKMALVAAFKGEKMDAAAARALVDEDFALMGELAKGAAGAAVEIFSSMTPAQLKEIRDGRAEREAACK
jgi:Spy/CpxP family protein refolding chaperone